MQRNKPKQHINLKDLAHSVSGWIDWNLILDTNGGPNYYNGFADAPIIVNITSGEIFKQPTFYAIGHFSRFITEGSVRIDVSSSNGMLKIFFSSHSRKKFQSSIFSLQFDPQQTADVSGGI